MADDQVASPARGWAVLRAGGKEPSDLGIPTKLTGVAAPAGPVRLALGDEGEARLLLPLTSGEDLRGIVGAPALGISVIPLEEHTRTRRFLDLVCRARELETVFSEVTDQIIDRIGKGTSSTEAARSTIDEFRALLTVTSSPMAPRETVAGLVGELLLLNELLERSPDAWKAWRGPEGARHDFVRGDVAVEVKVTMKKGKRTVTINGLEQLSEPGGGNLYLQHYELEAADNGPLNIRTLGRETLRLASQPQQVQALIASMGCLSIDEESWNAMSFRLEGDRLYRVSEGFPRITGAAFPGGQPPAGVSAVSYCVDLAVAASHRLDATGAFTVKGQLIP